MWCIFFGENPFQSISSGTWSLKSSPQFHHVLHTEVRNKRRNLSPRVYSGSTLVKNMGELSAPKSRIAIRWAPQAPEARGNKILRFQSQER